ncbi:FAD-dependent oxidoreductase [Corynebacterium mastitidis]
MLPCCKRPPPGWDSWWATHCASPPEPQRARCLARAMPLGGETLRLCPAVARSGMRGAWVNYDGQMVDDARMVTAVVRTAAREGARILTYCEATRASGDEVVLRNRLGAGS